MDSSGVMMGYNPPMDGMYQLVFSGELVKGQHRGVVKRRLGELLKLSEAQVEKLFTGNPVVVKRDVDEKAAEKFQELFKKAGGQLQVVPVETAAETAENAPAPDAVAAQPEEAPAEELEAASGTTAPDFDLADVGATMADESEVVPVVVPDANFEVAEVGSDMLEEPAVVDAPVIKDVDFDVAEVGADMGDRDDSPPPPAPDVSHIKLVD